MVLVNSINFILLVLIGLLHIYWLLGGKWALDGVFPEIEPDKKDFQPPPVATFIVILALFAGAFLHLSFIDFLPDFYRKIGLLGMGLVFLLRVIGEFKYIGLFKKKRATIFAKRDSLYYIPLCALLSINAFLAAGFLPF